MKQNQLKSTYENSFCNLPFVDERASLSGNQISEFIFNNNKKQSSMMKMYSSSRAVKFLTAFLMSMALTVFSLQKANAQSVTVSGADAASNSGSYTTLKGAFDAINASSQTGNNIVITVSGTTNETSSAILNQSAGPWASLTIKPSGTASITGAITAGNPLINLNGADNVTIDGLNTLTISNTTSSATTGTSTIKLINDATFNVIKNATILSQYNATTVSTANVGGCVWFSTGTTTGNDNNKVANCNLTTVTTSFSRGVTSFGTTTSATLENSNDTLTNNNIYNCFAPGGSSAAIYLATGSQTWVVTNNNIYQTATQTQTTAGSYYGIFISNTANTAGSFTITGNAIGYGSSSRSGRSQYNGTVGTTFYGINFAQQSTGGASTISNNIVSDISYIGTSTSTAFYGIYNIGTASTLTLNNDTIKNIDLGTAHTTSYMMYPGAATTVTQTNCYWNNIRSAYSGTIYLNYLGVQTTGTYNNNTFDSIVRTFAGTSTTYSFYVSTTVTNFTANNNTFTRYQGTNAAASPSFYCFYQLSSSVNETYRNNTISNFTVTPTTTGTSGSVYCFYGGSGAGNKVLIGNTITNINMPNVSTFYNIRLGGAGTYDSVVNNKTTNLVLAGGNSGTIGATSCTIYGFYITTGGTTNNIYANKISNVTGNISTLYGNYMSTGTTNNVFNDTISNIVSNYSFGGFFYCAYIVGGTTNNYYNNYINNITNSNLGTAGSIYGAYISSGTTNNVYGNTFSNLTNNGTTSPNLHGIWVTGGTTNNIYQNTINTLNNAGTVSPILSGIYVSGGTNNVIYRNKVYDLIDSTNPSSTTPLVYGLWLSGGGTGTAPGFLFYENVIGNLRAPLASNIQAIQGLGITSTSTATYKIYNNTVSLNASSAGTNFGTSGIFHTASTTATIAALDLRNNIIINNSTPSGTGVTVAYLRSSGGGVANLLNNYSANSNRNIFYAGVPSATNLIYADSSIPSAAIHTAQTLADYTSLAYGSYTIAPRDAASKTENTTFASTVGSASNYLSPSTTAFTYAESGGATLGTGAPANFPWKVDYLGAIRQDSSAYSGFGTAPDMGAYEINNGSTMFVLSDNPNGQVVKQNISVNTTDNIFHQAQLQVNYGTGVLSSVSFVLNGTSTYVSGDVTNFKLYYTTTNTFATTNLLGTQTSTSTGSGETITFSGLTQSLPVGTYYLWLTANIPGSATVGNSFLVNGMTASSVTISTSGAVVSSASTTSISGLQTIANACSGTPTTGTASSLVSNVCPNATTTLSLSGTTVGTGITYEWHSSLDNFVTLDSVMGTSPTQATVPNSTLTYYYQCKVTCANSGQSSFSNTVTVSTYNTALSIAATNNAQYCGYTNNPVKLTATTAGATPTSIVWTPVTELFTNTPATTPYTLNTNAPIVYSTATVARTYTATAIYTGIGCASTTATQVVTVGKKVTISSVGASNNPVCAGNTSSLTALATIGSTVNQYSFAASTGATLDPMTNDTTICLANDDDTPNGYTVATTVGTPKNINFTFNYEGVDYTQFSASPDGWIRLGSTTPASSFSNATSTATQIPAILAYWDDLATGTDGKVSYVITGSAPNRILKVQWKVTVPRATSGASNSLFQAWLYEGTNKIELRYGTIGSASMSATVGLIGASAANFNEVTIATGTSSSTTAQDNNTGQPTSGTMYTFNPPSVSSVIWSPSTNLSGTSGSPVTFTMPTSNPASVYVYTVTATGADGCYTNTLSGGIALPANDTLKLSTAAPTFGGTGIPSAVKNYATTIASNASVCPGNHVVLKTPTINGGCAPFTYQWIKNDDGTVYSTKDSLAFDATANASFGTADYYYLNVTDVQGQTVQSQYFLLNITDNAFSVTPTPSNAVICSTGSVSLAATATNGATLTYAWSPSTGLSATTGATVTATPTITTTYSVTSTGNGCVSPAKTVTVIFAPKPTGVAAASSTPSVCASNNNFSLSASATNGGSLSFTNNVGYNNFVYYSTSTGTSNYGEQFDAISPFTLNSVVVYPYSATDNTAGTITIQLKNSAGTVVATSSALAVTGWSTANAAAHGQAVNLGFNVPVGTGYQLVLSAYTGVSGLYYQYLAGGFGYPMTVSGVASITNGLLAGTAYTTYNYYFYNWSITNVVTNPVTSWSWTSSPGGFTSNTQNPSSVSLQGGPQATTYTVTATNSFGCSSTGSVTVSLGGGTPSVSVSKSTGTQAGCYNRNVILHADLTGGCSPFTYQWYLNGTALTNGTNVSGATSDSLKLLNIQASQAGNYTVTVTDIQSQTATSSAYTVDVLTPGAVSITPSQSLVCGSQVATLTVVGGASGAAHTWTPITNLYVNGGNTAYTLNKDTTTVFVKLSSNTTYTVSTVDNNGCTVTATQAMVYGSNQTLSITAAAAPLSVCAGNTSSLTSTFLNQLLANTYTFGATTGATLDPMVNDTTICLANDDDTPNGYTVATTVDAPKNINFTFYYEGVAYTQFSASPDAWIRLGGATPASSFTNAITTATQVPALIAYWDDLATGTDGRVSYVVTGTAPNRILKVNWKVTIPRNTTGASNSQFQIWLYETSNKIEYRYGTMASAAMSASVGLIGATPSNFLSVSLATNTTSISVANDANAIQPASGTMYTFTPLAPATKVTWTPATAELSASTGTAVTFTMPGSGAASTYSYNATVTDTITGCYAKTATPIVISLATGAPVITSVTKSQDNVCKTSGGATTLSVNITNGCAPYSYRWKLSGASTYFDSTINTNASIATTIVNPSATTSYVVDVVDNSGAVATGTNTTTLTIFNPSPVSATGTTICGSGIPTVTAVSNSGNSIAWYSALTGGTYLGTGNSFSPTAAISSTTTYYAAEVGGGTTLTGGKPTTNGTDGSNTGGGIYFTANQTFTLTSVNVYPTAAGTLNVYLYAGSTTSGTALQTYTTTISAGQVNTWVTLPLNFVNITPGTYTLYQPTLSMWRDYSSSLPANAYPYNIGSTVTLTDGTLANYYYFFYNWTVSTGCEGATRLPAVATVTPRASIALSNNSQVTTQTIAPGTNDNIISTGTVTVTNNATTLSALAFNLTGNYTAADITAFKLRLSATNTLASATTLGTQTSVGGAETVSFTALNTALPIGTYYIWLTADIASGATVNDSLKVSALGSGGFTLTGCNNTITGTISATGLQVLTPGCFGTPNAVTFATSSYTACTGATVPTISGTNNNGTISGYTYQWYSCDDAAGTNPVAINGANLINYKPANYTTAGTYYYYVAVTCFFSSQSTNSAVASVTVTYTPSVSLGVSPSATVCGGTSVTITDANYVSGYTYTWTPNVSTTQSAIVTPSVTTKYKVTSTNGACVGKADSTTITVTATPTVDSVRSSSAAVCTGTTVNLKSYASAGGYVSSTQTFENGGTFPPTGWTLINAGSGNNWISTTPTNHTTGGTYSMRYSYSTSAAANAWAITPAYNLVAGNTYTISLWYGSSYGGTSYNEKFDVTVGTAATVAAQNTILFSSGNVNSSQSTWLNGTVTFAPTTTGTYYFGFNCNSITNQGYLELDDITISGGPVITGYNWASAPAGFSSSVQNPNNVTVANTGSNTYSVTVTNNFGCTATGSVSVTGNPLPASPTATNTGTTTCGTPTFTASSNSGVGSPVYAWYNTATGTAVSGQTSSSYSPISFAVGNDTAYVSEVSALGCLSPKTQSIVTVTTPDAFALATHSATICTNTSLALSVSAGTLANYSTVTWSPITNLYTNAGLTTPYTAGANFSTVYVKPTTAGSITYLASASGSTGGNASCINSDTVRITAQSPIVVTAQPPVNTSTCGAISTTLSVSAVSTGTISYQWQSATDSLSWANVSNGTPSGTTYTGATTTSLAIATLNAPIYYRALLSDGVCSNVGSNASLIFAGTPSIASIAGDSTCQPTASISTLVATPSTGSSTRWYATNVSSTVLYNGTSYSTPALSTTTTYYAEPYVNYTTPARNVGYTSSTYYSSSTGTSNYGIQFNANNIIALNSVVVYPIAGTDGTGGTITVQLKNSVGTVLNTATVSVVGYTSGNSAAHPQTVNLGFTVPVGTGYQLVLGSYTGITGLWYSYNSGLNLGFPFADASNTISITNGLLAGTSYNYYWYYFYNFNITPQYTCTGTRVAVTAKRTSAPSITVTGGTTNCSGTSATLSASSANPGYKYTWRSNDGNTVLNGGSQTVNPSVTTAYSLTATDTSTGTYIGCFGSGSALVTVAQIPTTVTVNASPTQLCGGGTTGLTLTGGVSAGMTILPEPFEISSPIFTNTSGATVSTNSTYFAQGSKSALITYGNGLSSSTAGTYELNQNIDLSKFANSGTDTVTLTFKQICATEQANDYGYVEYSTNGGTTWTAFATNTYRGSGTLKNSVVSFDASSYTAWNTQFISVNSVPNNTLWKTETIKVPFAAYTSQFRFRFRVVSSASNVYYGWLIDDVKLTGGTVKRTFAWSNNTGATFTNFAQQSPNVSPTQTTTYNVVVSNSYGCTATAATPVTVTYLASSVQGTPTASVSAVCNSGSVTLGQTGGSLSSGAYWAWYTNASFASNYLIDTTSNPAATITKSLSTTTTYYLRAEGTSTCSNTGGSSVTVTVNKTSVAPTAAQASVTVVCGSTSETFTQTGGTLGTGATWKWYSDAAFTNLIGSSSAANASLTTTITTAGTFYVRAEGATAPCSIPGNSAAASVTVISGGSVTASISGNASVCSPGGVSKTISIAFSGYGPWTTTYTNGTTPTTVSNITTSPYTFNVAPSATTTYSLVSVYGGGTTTCAGNVSGSAVYTVNAIPVATATPANQNACSGSAISQITFGTSNNVSGTTFSWTRNNTSAATGIAASGSSFVAGTLTNTSGTTTVTFNVTPTGPAPSSCVGSPITATVVVYNPATVYNVTGGGAYCSLSGTGVPVGLSGSQSGYTYQMLYNSTSSSLLGTGSALNFGNQTTAATYTVTASNAGCSTPMSGSAVVTITSPTTPSLRIIASDTVACGGTNVAFFAVGTNGGSAPMYNFFVDGVSKQNSTNNEYLTSSLTNGAVVTCVMTSNASCQTTATASSINSITMTITGGATLAAPKAITGTTTNCTVGSSNFLKDSTPGGLWRSSDTTVATINMYSGLVSSKKNGITAIDYIISGSNGCKNIASTLYAVAERSAPAAITTLAGSTSISVCQGGTNNLKSDTTGVWTTSSSSLLSVGSTTGVVSGTTSTVTGSSTGYVYFTATNSYGCSKTVSTPITVYGKPGVPTIQYAAGTVNPQNGPGGSFCLNKGGVPNSFSIVGAGTGGGTGAYTSSNPNVLTLGPTNGLVTFVAAGNATITYTFTNTNGCSNSRSVALTVANCPGSRGIESVATKTEMDFTLYPNPAKGTVTVTTDFVQVGGGQITVTDMLGKQVRKQALSLGANRIDISNLSKGFYFVNVVTNEGNKTKKLVIE